MAEPPERKDGPDVIPEKDERIHMELLQYLKKFPWGKIRGRLGDMKYLDVENGRIIRPGPNDIVLPRWVSKVDYILVDKAKDRWDVRVYDSSKQIRMIVEMKGTEIQGVIDKHINKLGEDFTRAVRMLQALDTVKSGLMRRGMMKETEERDKKGRVINKAYDNWIYKAPPHTFGGYEHRIEVRHNKEKGYLPVLVVKRFKIIEGELPDGTDTKELKAVDTRKITWEGIKTGHFEIVMTHVAGADYDPNAKWEELARLKVSKGEGDKWNFYDQYGNGKIFEKALNYYLSVIKSDIDQFDLKKSGEKKDSERRRRDKIRDGLPEGTLDKVDPPRPVDPSERRAED